jgi:hypothetical protein
MFIRSSRALHAHHAQNERKTEQAAESSGRRGQGWIFYLPRADQKPRRIARPPSGRAAGLGIAECWCFFCGGPATARVISAPNKKI